MDTDQSQAAARCPKDRARALILDALGAKRVAGWCGVAENTVHQWLSRGTDDAPIPSGRVPAILAGARREGVECPAEVLWPAMAGLLAEAVQ